MGCWMRVLLSNSPIGDIIPLALLCATDGSLCGPVAVEVPDIQCLPSPYHNGPCVCCAGSRQHLASPALLTGPRMLITPALRTAALPCPW